MKNKKRNRVYLLLILLLGISIGFAALATTLKINGTANIGKNSWNIYWDNIANQKGATAAEGYPKITADENNVPKTLLSWNVTLDQPGDYYEFEVDAVNAGTLDAEIIGIESKYDDTSVITTNNGVLVEDNSVIPSYIKYSVKEKETGNKPALGDKLPKAPDPTAATPVYTRKTYVVRVEYDREAITNTIVNNMASIGESHEFNFQITYGQATSPVIPAAVAFSTDSWETIAAEGNEAAEQTEVTNGKCGVYNIGDTRTIDMGTLGVHTVRIANCSTPSVCSTNGFSQTACGFVIEFTDVITDHKMNSLLHSSMVNGDGNTGSWEHSDMRAFLNGKTYAAGSVDYSTTGIYSKLPVDLQNKLATTTVVTGYGNQDSTNFTTTDELYLPSAHEVWEDSDGNSNYGIDRYDTGYNSTRQFDYYKALNVTTSSYTSASKGSTCWLRTPDNGGDANFYDMLYSGSVASSGSEATIGVSPAFKLK